MNGCNTRNDGPADRTHTSSPALPRPRGAGRGRVAALATLAIALAGCSGGEGTANAASSGPTLGPSELAILVAEGDVNGEAIARAYQRARGVPDANVIRVRVPATGHEIGAADFAALKATIDARLPATVHATLLTWTAPSRVVGTCTMSITSALALGFDEQWCANTCAATAPTTYFGSTSRRPFTDLASGPR